MEERGDCFSCKKVESCTGTSVAKIFAGFTCQLFEGISEHAYLARFKLIKQFTETQVIQALRPKERGEGNVST